MALLYSLALILLIFGLNVEAYQIYAWGENEYGQLGIPNVSVVYNPQLIPKYQNANIVQLKMSGTLHMAIDANGDVYTCGNNWYGGLGLALATGPVQTTPVNNTALKGCTVYLGKRHGNAVCGNSFIGWGVQAGYVAGLTTGDYGKPHTSLANYKLGSNVVNVTAGSGFSILSLSNGTMVVAGDGTGGKLGINNTNQLNTFVAWNGFKQINVKLATIFPSIAEHICALSDSYEVYCWGSNIYGQLGIGNLVNQSLPTLVTALSSEYYVVQVVTGYYHTMALTAGGRVFCWGLGTNGVLGNGVSDNTTFPTPIEVVALADKNVVEIQAGLNFNFARTSDNKWYSWGAGYGGVLGTLNDADVGGPALVPFAFNINKIVTASTSRGVFGWLDPTAPNNTGYTGPALSNECETSPQDVFCAANSHCVDTDRGYMCSCNSGFAGSNSTGCQDINECLQSPSVCAMNGTCTNTPGSYNCSCPPNAPVGDGKVSGTGCSPLPTPPPTKPPTPAPTTPPTPTPSAQPTGGPLNGTSSNSSSSSSSGVGGNTTSTLSPTTTTSGGDNSTSEETGNSTTGGTNPGSTITSSSTTAASTNGKTNLYQTLFGSKDDINAPPATSTSGSGEKIIVEGSSKQNHDKDIMIGVLIAFAVVIAVIIAVGAFWIYRSRRPRKA